MVVQGSDQADCRHPSFEVSAPRLPALKLYHMCYYLCMTTYDEDYVSLCDRCGDTVGTETLVFLGPNGICEICWDDM
jgi:hypothetical protein